MSVTQIPAIGLQQPQRAAANDEATTRRMASEFEALLLNQLTASMNPVDGEDEEGLFSSSGGLGLSRQLFAEQFARTMAESGGIGLADMIVNQTKARAQTGNKTSLATAARAIRRDETSASSNPVVADPTNVGSTGANVRYLTRPRRVHPIVTTNTNVTGVVNTSRSTSISNTTEPPRAVPRVAIHAPIQGPLRSIFGPRRDPINGRHRFHKGIDIAAPSGMPIGAAAAGKVVFAGRNKGYGNMVMLEHADGRRTLYAHASQLFVKVGDTVANGQPIAAVGSTGHSTGPHLHFEIREGARAIDPLTILSNDFMLSRR
jgi:murein DD-endopeptidase MepM/ murein hydrolase activator NlpD